MTRGALTTFSVANDLAKYFTILPAMLTGIAAFQLPRVTRTRRVLVAQHHATGVAVERDLECRDSQRADHHRAEFRSRCAASSIAPWVSSASCAAI